MTNLPVPNQAEVMMAVIERAASSSDVDVSKLEKMLDMQMAIMSKQAEISFNQAMSELQPELPTIHKKSKGHNTMYAKYEDIDKAIRPYYTKHGFSVSYTSKKEGDTVTYFGTASHREGHKVTAEITLTADTSGNKNAIQAVGSTVSYAKRYLLCMLFNIVTTDEDNDAVALSESIRAERAKEIEESISKMKDGADYKVKFLKFMKADAIENIKVGDYEKAINAIKAKEKKNAGA